MAMDMAMDKDLVENWLNKIEAIYDEMANAISDLEDKMTTLEDKLNKLKEDKSDEEIEADEEISVLENDIENLASMIDEWKDAHDEVNGALGGLNHLLEEWEDE